MVEMTRKERLLAAIRFEGPDRVPVFPRMWRYLLKHAGTQKHGAYLAYADEFGFDPILHYSAGPVHFVPQPGADYQALGPEIRVDERVEQDGQVRVVSRTFQTPAGRLTDRTRIPPSGGEFGIAPNPHIEEYLVKGPDDLPALKAVVDANAAAAQVADFRAADKELAGRALAAANTYSALSHNAGDAYPLEQMMIDCFDRREFVEELIDVFHAPLLAMTRRALERGAELVYCSVFFESMSSGWSPQLYSELFAPRIRAHVELVHSAGALYHLYDDGKVAATLPILRGIGIDMLSTVCPPPSGDVALSKARQAAGSDVCLNGGIDTVNTIWRGTPESIDAAIREAVAAAATPAGGYIIGSSDSITEETPPANFRAFFDAARRHGTPG
ncbi:MAG TPA: uroporphyrinogen decarboxylase family protein [Phycisphaerae bacterium]|nr:uroporphyrinogen decarboxylase family protein [Phycisphaerae bacterium]